MASVNGKVIVVAGAASGIGRATAVMLASRGAILSLSDINTDGLASTMALLDPSPDSARPHISAQVDISDSSAVDAWIKDTVARLGPLAGAANVAGLNLGLSSKPLRYSSDEDWNLIMDVNGKGTFNLMRAQLSLGGLSDGGSIVNVTSGAGLRGLRHSGTYSASKHAIVGLTKTAAIEEGPNGIRINCVAPGVIETPMTDVLGERYTILTDGQVMKRKGEPREAASVIAFLLSDEASFVTGAAYEVDAGWTA